MYHTCPSESGSGAGVDLKALKAPEVKLDAVPLGVVIAGVLRPGSGITFDELLLLLLGLLSSRR